MAEEIVIGSDPKMFPVDDVMPATNPIWTESLMKSLSRRFKREILVLPDEALPVINAPYDSLPQESPAKNPDEIGSWT